jgi:hypothetical protein
MLAETKKNLSHVWVKCIITKDVLGGYVPSTEIFLLFVLYSEIDGKVKQETLFLFVSYCFLLFLRFLNFIVPPPPKKEHRRSQIDSRYYSEITCVLEFNLK